MDSSLEMKYESLILKIWDKTEQMDDPFGFANADLYDREIKTLDEKLMFSLEAGLRRLNYKFQNSDYSEIDRLFANEILLDFFSINCSDDFDALIKKTLDYLDEKE